MAKKKGRIRAAKLQNIQNSGYSEGGASQTNNILKTWNPWKLSSKSDIDQNLNPLRNRAADTAINTPIGAAAIQSSATHAVGTGLTLFPRPRFK